MPRPRIIAALAPRSLADLPADGADRVAPADLVEVRLDALQGGPDAAAGVCRAVAGWGRPLLVTPRSGGEGGLRDWDMAARREVLQAVWQGPGVALVDVELRDSPQLLDWVLSQRPAGVAVIASFHDFNGFPGEARLAALADEAAAKGADHFKAAVRVADLDQTARLACWTRERSQSQSLLSMAMGPAGTLSRIMGGAFGSWGTFGHLGTATAPGQLSVADLAELRDRLYPE
jgi:3-dehydroquinate dehydratase-1